MRFAMGPMELDLLTFLGLRLNEHSLHAWDIAVAFDAGATPARGRGRTDHRHAPDDDRLGRQAHRGRQGRLDSDRGAQPHLHAGLAARWRHPVARDPVDEPDLELPAEALIRLVYGRLDPDHTPAGMVGAAGHLDELRKVFPGFLSPASGEAPRQRLVSTQPAMSRAMPAGSSSGPK